MGNALYFGDNLDVLQRDIEAETEPAPEAITDQFPRGILWGAVFSLALWIVLGLTLALVLA
jgi:hypothetical protein